MHHCFGIYGGLSVSDTPQETIQGSVHGLMSLVGAETALLPLLSTPELRRLKRIKQLGMAAEVFPDAEHSRFAHSLGVAYLALRFGRRLKEVIFQRGSKEIQELSLSPEDIRDFAIAALCHDLGHGPFSHAWEHEVIGKDFSRRDWCESLKTGFDPDAPHVQRMKWHELVGQGLILGSESELRRRLEEIGLGTSEKVSQLLLGRHDRLDFLSRLLSSDLDVDRCDFILRDSTQAGVSYGHYDLNWLIDTLSLVQHKQGKWVIGFQKKADRALEQVVIARRSLYEKVYFHKTVKSAEIMMGLVLQRLKYCVRKHEKLPKHAEHKMFEPLMLASVGKALNRKHVLALDDALVWQLFTLLSEEETKSYDRALQDLASRLVNRELFKQVANYPGDGTPEKLNRAFDEIEKRAMSLAGLNREEALRYYCKVYRTDNDPLSTEQKDEVYLIKDGKASPLHNEKDFLPLRMHDGRIQRLYVVDEQTREAIEKVFAGKDAGSANDHRGQTQSTVPPTTEP